MLSRGQGLTEVPARGTSKSIFPTEIVDNIAAALIGDGKHFLDVANFSLTCYKFRQIAFRRYFAHLHAWTKSQWFRRCRIPGIFLWVRTIQCNSTALYVRPTMLQQFINLESAIISFHTEGRNTQHTSTRLILKNIPSQLTHLTMEYLPLLNSSLLQLISDGLPNLQSLRLSCWERLSADLDCCWDCYEESGSYTLHSPIPNHYCDVYDLIRSLGQPLASLSALEELFLGIYLSHEEIFYEHIAHADYPGTPDPYGPHECELCEELYANDVRETEMIASAEIAQYLPMLKTISWSSFFAGNLLGDDPLNQKTTMWIKRDGETLAVKRGRW